MITTGFGVTIDLPLFDRNQGAIAVEDATRTKLFDEYVARLFEARGEIARIVADMNSLRRQIEAAENVDSDTAKRRRFLSFGFAPG